MATNYEVRYAAHPEDFSKYDTARIRRDFLVQNLFITNEVRMIYSHYDRYLVGGAVPGEQSLPLEAIEPLKADFFLERREIGIINVGGPGHIQVAGENYAVGYKEALYIGQGQKDVRFSSNDPQHPARFYFNSTPAHKSYPTRLVTQHDAAIVHLGAQATANERVIYKLLVNSVLPTCQLQMGMTELRPGSVWNTMPAHTHDRRMEVYFYFELPEDQSVCHFMGQPQETRPIWMHNENAVISPPWSIHCGAGTSHYTFIWGMAGENLDYSDMDGCSPTALQ